MLNYIDNVTGNLFSLQYTCKGKFNISRVDCTCICILIASFKWAQYVVEQTRRTHATWASHYSVGEMHNLDNR